jgi:hypothetical protein
MHGLRGAVILCARYVNLMKGDLIKAGRYVDETRGRAADAAGAVRDAASRGAQTVTGGRQDHGSAGPTGAAYRDAAG